MCSVFSIVSLVVCTGAIDSPLKLSNTVKPRYLAKLAARHVNVKDGFPAMTLSICLRLSAVWTIRAWPRRDNHPFAITSSRDMIN